MTRLYLIRHGRSTWNALGRIQGQADAPLDELGRRQAQALAVRFASETLHAVYSSSLARARETADLLAAPHGLTVAVDSRLAERDYGEWTGLTGSEVEVQIAAHPDLDWRVDGPPGGESRAAVATRVSAAFADILVAHPDRAVAVVAHGAALGIYLASLLGLPLDRPVAFVFENTAVTQLKVQDGRVYVVTHNDARHLDGLV